MVIIIIKVNSHLIRENHLVIIQNRVLYLSKHLLFIRIFKGRRAGNAGTQFQNQPIVPVSLSAYPGTSGRGPTKLISPINTFHNSGNSSILYFLSTAPKGVIRFSPAIEIEHPEWDTCIDRNLYIVNNRPFCPTRTCLKSTGPSGILIRINTATTNSIGHNNTSPNKATIRSNKNFNNISSKAIRINTKSSQNINCNHYTINSFYTNQLPPLTLEQNCNQGHIPTIAALWKYQHYYALYPHYVPDRTWAQYLYQVL